jgi:hypothetical protein
MLVLVGEATAGSVTLKSGDELRIAHTRLHCGISPSDGAIGIQCFIATADKDLVPGTYGVSLSPRRATIFRAISGHRARLVASRAEPDAQKPTFPKAKPRLRRLFTLRAGDRTILGGTDIVCAVVNKQEMPVIGCSHLDNKFDSIPDTWGIFLEREAAAMARFVDKAAHVSNAVVRRQP